MSAYDTRPVFWYLTNRILFTSGDSLVVELLLLEAVADDTVDMMNEAG